MMRPIAGLLAASAIVLGCAREARAPSADARTALALDAEASEAVRAEMRTMLTSIQEILVALPGRDTAAVRAAAAAAGMGAAADTALEHVLPATFLQIGTATHRGFDSLAAAAGTLPADSVVARLGRITSMCVACHAQFRLAAR